MWGNPLATGSATAAGHRPSLNGPPDGRANARRKRKTAGSGGEVRRSVRSDRDDRLEAKRQDHAGEDPYDPAKGVT